MKRRDFIKNISATAITSTMLSSSGCSKSDVKAKIVIVGGGAAGIDAAARLMRSLSSPDITLIDPSQLHYYQPGFTLIAGGIYSPDEV